jgi:hypothetical protein
MTNLIAVKLVIILALLLFFIFIVRKPVKAAILAVLIYIGIPTPEDLIIVPSIASALHTPLMPTAIIYYALIWIFIFIVWITL